MNLADIVTSGPLLLGVAIAVLAGVVSFASPCCLPLMPGYVSYVTGLSGSEIAAGDRRGRVLTGAVLFVAGFTAVYILTVFALQTIGRSLLTNGTVIETVVGVLMIAMGIMFIGAIPMGRGFQLRWRPAVGLAGAPVFGAVFAISWIPCVSPVLAAVTGFAYIQDGAARGITLIIAYCLGLGIPFIAIALGMHKLNRAVGFLRRHGRAISIAGGIMLMMVGIMLVTGAWGEFINWLRATVGVGVSPI
ncbi:cytochrome c biogenesis CcdA family protein [Glycomyces albus]